MILKVSFIAVLFFSSFTYGYQISSYASPNNLAFSNLPKVVHKTNEQEQATSYVSMKNYVDNSIPNQERAVSDGHGDYYRILNEYLLKYMFPEMQ